MSGFDRRAFADDGHWFLNKYECDCGTEWSDGWACTVDDDCPTCGTSTSPTSSEDQTADVIDGDADLARMVKLDDGDGRRFELAHLFTLPATDDEIMTAAVVELLKAGDGAAFCARCLGELFYGETQEEAFKNAADFAKDADGDPEDISV
ncbi:MAG: hypothetical protein KKA05_10420, partial [Alphaproteobacteria bacterium]|nr:hypothetical protein [Alphaproteobacteria bacterium]